jgi:hypothetical protein
MKRKSKDLERVLPPVRLPIKEKKQLVLNKEEQQSALKMV